jgi:hypothetical protein
MMTITLPLRFVQDWLDIADGEFFNLPDRPETAVSVVKATQRTITIEAGVAAIRDLRQRAECYAEETYDDPYLRGLQASARAVLRHLKAAGL